MTVSQVIIALIPPLGMISVSSLIGFALTKANEDDRANTPRSNT